MKKQYLLPIILFVVFLVADIILYVVIRPIDYGRDFQFYFLPAIFIEIAIFGCIIIYLIIKNTGKKDE